MKVPAVRLDKREGVSGQGESLQRIPCTCQGTEKGNDPAAQNTTAVWWGLFFQLVRQRKGHGANTRRENRSAEKGLYHKGNLSEVKMARFSLYKNLM